jgi:hypothetical protein
VEASPDEFARPSPAPCGLAIDTLAMGTLPDSTLGELADGPDQEASRWSEAYRGVSIRPALGVDPDEVREFVVVFARARTEARHERSWYLVSLAFLLLAAYVALAILGILTTDRAERVGSAFIAPLETHTPE